MTTYARHNFQVLVRKLERNMSLDRLKIAGASFLAVKSPEAPNITITVGGVACDEPEGVE